MSDRAGTLVIVPCGKSKIWDRDPDAGPTAARAAYVGSPFKVNREYAETFGEAWVILSAKYGFLQRGGPALRDSALNDSQCSPPSTIIEGRAGAQPTSVGTFPQGSSDLPTGRPQGSRWVGLNSKSEYWCGGEDLNLHGDIPH